MSRVDLVDVRARMVAARRREALEHVLSLPDPRLSVEGRRWRRRGANAEAMRVVAAAAQRSRGRSLGALGVVS